MFTLQTQRLAAHHPIPGPNLQKTTPGFWFEELFPKNTVLLTLTLQSLR